MSFENRIVGEMVDFNLEKFRGMFRLGHLPFECLQLFIESLAAKDIVVSLPFSSHMHAFHHTALLAWET